MKSEDVEAARITFEIVWEQGKVITVSTTSPAYPHIGEAVAISFEDIE